MAKVRGEHSEGKAGSKGKERTQRAHPHPPPSLGESEDPESPPTLTSISRRDHVEGMSDITYAVS